MKEDSCCYNTLINNYDETLSSKTKSDLFNNIKNNKNVMKDLKNILKAKIIHNIISHGNLVDKQKLEKKINDYLYKCPNCNDNICNNCISNHNKEYPDHHLCFDKHIFYEKKNLSY